MSLLHYTAYSHYANTELTTSNDLTGISGGVYGSDSAQKIMSGGGRDGRSSFRLTTGFYGSSVTSYGYKTVTPGDATAITGFAYRINGLGNISYYGVMGFALGTAYQTYLEVNQNGTLTLRFGNNAGSVLATSNTVIVNNNYHFIDIETLVHPVSGTFNVYVDKVLALSYTGNTRAAANAAWDTVMYGNLSGSVNQAGITVDYTDSYILDGTGSSPYNVRLNDVAVDAYYPIADGDYAQFTNSVAGSHYTLVDDNPVNTTDYLHGGTINYRDSFVYTIPSGGTILAANMALYAKKDAAGTRGIKEFVRAGGTNYDNANEIQLSSSYRFFNNIRTVNPSTSAAWAAGNVEFGILVSS
jgi:hypothetical protein